MQYVCLYQYGFFIIALNNVIYFVLKAIQLCNNISVQKGTNSIHLLLYMYTQMHTMICMQHVHQLSTLLSFQNARFKEQYGKASMNSNSHFHQLEIGQILQKTEENKSCVIVDCFSGGCFFLWNLDYTSITFILSSRTLIV